MTAADRESVRQLCAEANAQYGTDLYFVGNTSKEADAAGTGYIIRSSSRRYCGIGTVDELRRLILAFAGGWVAHQEHDPAMPPVCQWHHPELVPDAREGVTSPPPITAFRETLRGLEPVWRTAGAEIASGRKGEQ